MTREGLLMERAARRADVNWIFWRIWRAGRDPINDIRRWPMPILLQAHKVLDYEIETSEA